MSDVDRLLNQYTEEHRAGGTADPIPYLEQLEGTDREELATLIDGYLQRAPAREWDADAYRGSAPSGSSNRWAALARRSRRAWPVLLPRLRERAKV